MYIIVFCAVSVCCAVNKESCAVNKCFVLCVYSIVLYIYIYMYIVFVCCVCAVSMTTTPDTNTRTQHNKENNKSFAFNMCLCYVFVVREITSKRIEKFFREILRPTHP